MADADILRGLMDLPDVTPPKGKPTDADILQGLQDLPNRGLTMGERMESLGKGALRMVTPPQRSREALAAASPFSMPAAFGPQFRHNIGPWFRGRIEPIIKGPTETFLEGMKGRMPLPEQQIPLAQEMAQFAMPGEISVTRGLQRGPLMRPMEPRPPGPQTPIPTMTGERPMPPGRPTPPSAADPAGELAARAGVPRGGAQTPIQSAEEISAATRQVVPEAQAKMAAALAQKGEVPVSAVEEAAKFLKEKVEPRDIKVKVPKDAPAQERVMQGRASIKGVNLKGIEGIRSQLVKRLQNAKPMDQAGIQGILERFDKQIDDTVTHGLFTGDAKAIEQLKEARGVKTLIDRWAPQGLARKIVDNSISPDGVAKMLFSLDKIGAKEPAIKFWNDLKTLLPEEIVNNYRAAMIDHIKGDAAQLQTLSESTLGKKMFNPDELALMKAAARAKDPQVWQQIKQVVITGIVPHVVSHIPVLGKVLGPLARRGAYKGASKAIEHYGGIQ